MGDEAHGVVGLLHESVIVSREAGVFLPADVGAPQAVSCSRLGPLLAQVEVRVQAVRATQSNTCKFTLAR